MEQSSTSTPITIEDVRAAVEQLGGPNHTNAAKIREVLGRGSLATIQKHLQALRDAQSTPDLPEDQENAPPVPSDLTGAFQAVWTAAWTMAEQRHAAVLAKLLAENQTLATDLETARADLTAMLEQFERAEARAEMAEKSAAEAQAALEQERAAMAGERTALEQIMAQLRGMIPTMTS
ncbi:hypothetical protein HF283_09830 [Acidithiobacillus ferrooxidans]|uniref:DNA-binding protein n=1 Tax=Acidithiobacillus ferridurans TaxID=1232575 RepID=UPI001C073C4E|nr:DNA-binding protein [Acidithiobacillus ferridurans]MBU2805401.1 hypothetical protein [Acidithiobacillus ferridurans]MBU2824404.1 hypothetical protein [Acidithiobacillus ferrooxidans]